MTDRSWEIQQAMHTRLTGSHSFGADWYAGSHLENVALPYGVLDQVIVRDASMQNVSGADHLLTLHYYGRTTQAVFQAMAEAVTLNHANELTLASGVNYCLSHELQFAGWEGEAGNRFVHGVQQWRILTDG